MSMGGWERYRNKLLTIHVTGIHFALYSCSPILFLIRSVSMNYQGKVCFTHSVSFTVYADSSLFPFMFTFTTIVLLGADTDKKIGSSLPIRESFISDMRNIPQEELGGRCVIELSTAHHLNREFFSSHDDYR